MKKSFELFRKLNTNLVIACSALLVSACALFVSIQEVRIMREQQRATLYPHLSLSFRYNGDGFGVFAKNSGNGLAKVNSYRVYNDSIFFKTWFQAIEHYCSECLQDINYGNMSSNIIQDEVITPGEEIKLFFVRWSPASRKLEKRINGISIDVCYSSLLGDNWQLKDGMIHELEEPCPIEIGKEFEKY